MISVYQGYKGGKIQSKNPLFRVGFFACLSCKPAGDPGCLSRAFVFSQVVVQGGDSVPSSSAKPSITMMSVLCRVTLDSGDHLESQDLQGKLYVCQALCGPAFHCLLYSFLLSSAASEQAVLTTSIRLFIPFALSLHLEQCYFT